MITGPLFILTFFTLVSLNFSDPGILHRGEDSVPPWKELPPQRLAPHFQPHAPGLHPMTTLLCPNISFSEPPRCWKKKKKPTTRSWIFSSCFRRVGCPGWSETPVGLSRPCSFHALHRTARATAVGKAEFYTQGWLEHAPTRPPIPSLSPSPP